MHYMVRIVYCIFCFGDVINLGDGAMRDVVFASVNF